MSEQAIKKILITGANGFIGGSLMRYYQNQGQDVVGVDLVGNADDIVEGDISQPDTISITNKINPYNILTLILVITHQRPTNESISTSYQYFFNGLFAHMKTLAK
jgi:nucleoside-diphosphate-sugar epimerase